MWYSLLFLLCAFACFVIISFLQEQAEFLFSGKIKDWNLLNNIFLRVSLGDTCLDFFLFFF